MNTTSKILAFALALGLAIPTVATLSITDAHAAGGVLSSAGKDGKRTHKRASSKSKKKSKKKSKSKTKTTTTRRSGATRTTTTRTRVNRSARTTGTSHRHYDTSSRRTTYVRRSSRPTRVVRSAPSHRVVHHTDTVYVTDAPPAGRSTARSGGSSTDIYITGGVGISGFASQTISDEALPGVGWNVAVGGKGKYLGLEIGLDGGGYTFDPNGENSTDLAFYGIYGDLKLQPTIAGFFEPYVYAGVGGYVLGDAILDEASSGGALRLGLGANLRFDDIAIGGKYAWQTMQFADDSGSYGGDFGGQAETISLNLSIYF